MWKLLDLLLKYKEGLFKFLSNMNILFKIFLENLVYLFMDDRLFIIIVFIIEDFLFKVV